MKLHLLICLILLLAFSISAQSARESGIEFYKKGDYQSAIQYFEAVTKSNKTDDNSWNFLGLSYLNLSKFKESRKALENAVKLNPQKVEFKINLSYANLLSNRLSQAEKEINKAIAIDSQNATAFYIRGLIFLWKGKFDNAVADADQSLTFNKSLQVSYELKSNAYLYKFGYEVAKSDSVTKGLVFLQKSIESLESCVINCPRNSDFVKNPNKLDDLRAFYHYFSTRKSENINTVVPPANSDPSITPLYILSKPRANYTDSARQAGVQGEITMAILFSADGKSKMVLVLKPLSNGLTEEAVKAAEKINFNPQMKDGKPVSVVKLVKYTFTLY